MSYYIKREVTVSECDLPDMQIVRVYEQEIHYVGNTSFKKAPAPTLPTEEFYRAKHVAVDVAGYEADIESSSADASKNVDALHLEERFRQLAELQEAFDASFA